jgi:hypothetical protein
MANTPLNFYFWIEEFTFEIVKISTFGPTVIALVLREDTVDF